MYSKASPVLVAIVFSSSIVVAERTPDVPKDATHVLTGTVQRVFSRETGKQIQYIVEIEVSSVERPESLKPDGLLSVYCFQAKDVEPDKSATNRKKALATLNQIRESGHRAVPKEGQQIRAFAKPRHGRLEGLYPDWFSVVGKARQPETPVANKSAGAAISKATATNKRSHDNSEQITAKESERYYFELLQKAKEFRIAKEDAATYLRGVWRLDRKAHMAGGHYTRADQGDDVSLICTEKQLIQLDFNRNKPVTNEYVGSISNLQQDERGRLHFDKHRLYVPLSETHLMVGAYDYVVMLRRVSVRKK